MQLSDLIDLKLSNKYITISQYSNSIEERNELEFIFDCRIFKYYSQPYESCDEFIDTITSKLNSLELVPFLIHDNQLKQVVGTFSLKNIDLKNKVIEIGNGWMGLNFLHKYYITVTNLLLLTYLFEVLGFNRVQWKTDISNVASQKAAKSIGYKKDGVLRSYVLRANSECRDVVMFSILRSEWEVAKCKLKKRVMKKLQLSEKDII